MSDIKLPEPPALISEDDYDFPEITDTSLLKSESTLPLVLQAEDLAPLTLSPLDAKVLTSELEDYNLYLKNVHKGFSFATSVNSIMKLVGTGLAIHKQRRSILKEIRESKKDPFEMDEHGNLKS